MLFVIVSLTILLLVLGVQIFFILKDFRKTIRNVNKIFDDVSFLRNQTVQLLIGAFARQILQRFTKERGEKKVIRKKERSLEIKIPEIEEKTDRPVRRFFRGVPRTFYRS